jgi:hypothetical protein
MSLTSREVFDGAVIASPSFTGTQKDAMAPFMRRGSMPSSRRAEPERCYAELA